MSNRFYSLWLIPEDDVYKKYFQLITNLSNKYSSPNFKPHVTLIGRIQSNQNNIILKTKELVSLIKPFKIKLNGVDYQSSIHKTLFIKVVKTQDLNRTYLKAKEMFKYKENEYVPHLSLLYGCFSDEVKQSIIAKIGGKFEDEFPVNSIHIFDTTEKDERMWHEVDNLNLS